MHEMRLEDLLQIKMLSKVKKIRSLLLVLAMVCINTLITNIVAINTFIQLINNGLSKSLALILSIIIGVFLYLYIWYNNKILNLFNK
jgi:hypothetical protein